MKCLGCTYWKYRKQINVKGFGFCAKPTSWNLRDMFVSLELAGCEFLEEASSHQKAENFVLFNKYYTKEKRLIEQQANLDNILRIKKAMRKLK